jgi:hypothetical protein
MKVLRKEIPGCIIAAIDTTTNDWRNGYEAAPSGAGDLQGWNGVFTTSGPRFWYQDTLDINGVTQLMEKALAPLHIEAQQADFYRVGGVAAFDAEPDQYGVEYVMLTTVPFDADGWIRRNTNVLSNPGKLPTIFGALDTPGIKALSAGQCLYGRYRYLQNEFNTFERVALVKGESFFGSLDMTMSDELYLTRIIVVNGVIQNGNLIELPDIQLHIHMTTEELSDLAQIMELRRSYLTQQGI